MGPVLPIIEVTSMKEAYQFVKDRPDPLAVWVTVVWVHITARRALRPLVTKR